MSIIDQANEWLARRPPPRQFHVINSTHMEQNTMQRAVDEAPAIQELINTWGDVALNPTGLAEDLGLTFYKSQPELVDTSNLRAPERLNHAIASAVLEHPDIDELRQYTTYDRWASLLATQAMNEQVMAVLNEVGQDADHDDDLENNAQEKADRLEELIEQGAGDQEISDALADAEAAQITAEDERAFNDQDAHAIAVAAIKDAITQAINELEEQETAAKAWGLEPGDMKNMPDTDRTALVKQMHNNRMHKFAELIGRFRITANADQARKIEFGRHEPFTVMLGNQLDEVVGSELVKLAHPALRMDFLRRLGEHQLIQRKWRGEQKAAKGPMIVLIDTSGSMAESFSGVTREAWSKAVALALADVCHKQERAFTAVPFSSAGQVRIIDVPATNPTPALMQIGNTFFNGGTSFEGPLSIIRERVLPDNPRADVVIITDGECDVSPQFREQWQQFRNDTGVRVFGINIGGYTSPGLKKVCDNTRTIADLLDPTTVSDIYQSI